MAKSADAFRTISEVAEWLDTPAHVLRFWESRFSQVKPVKRAGGRRYYRPNDMLLLGGIKKLLHEDGMTIKGAQKLLRTDGVKKISALSQPIDVNDGDTIEMVPASPTKMAADTAAPLSIVASEDPAAAVEPAEPELEPKTEPEIIPNPEPAPEPEPEPEIIPAPVPEPDPQSEPEIIPEPAPENIVAAQSSTSEVAAADTGDAAKKEALSSIYSRLSTLHDRMKANIDHKQQG